MIPSQGMVEPIAVFGVAGQKNPIPIKVINNDVITQLLAT
jgi:hypothetical protein